MLLHLETRSFQTPQSVYAAVDLFFLISGFVIAAAYDEARIARIGVGGFIRARLIRLYPTFLLGMLILPAYFAWVAVRDGAWLAEPGALLRSLAAGLVFLPSHLPSAEVWEQEALFPLDMPAWSLMFELAVNLAYVLLLPWLSRFVLVFIVIGSGLILMSSQIPLNGLDLGWSWPTLPWGFPRVTFSFFLGVLVARSRIPRPAIPAILVLAAIPALFWVPGWLAILIGFPLVLVAATRPGQGPSRIMAALGALSYPLYAIHYPLLHWTRPLFTAWEVPDPWLAPANLAVILACAILALKLWDAPMRRWLARRWGTGGAGAPPI